MMKMLPINDKEELVVFGKGVGESILFCVAENKWIVIDSFIAPKTKKPIVLEYLDSRGIDYEKIIGIVCTHWDDDHIRGISNIIENHKAPLPVVLPIALREKRVLEYVYFNSDEDIALTTEFIKILKLKQARRCSFYWANSDRNLFGKEINDNNIIFKSLSPNDEQYEAFLKSIVLPESGAVKAGGRFCENSVSVAIYIRTPVDSFLLGGDLENSQLGGWDSICRTFHEPEKSHIFKIPHHGSSNAYCEGVWTTLVEKPVSIITRFNRSHLPKDEMINAMKPYSSRIFVVGPENKRDRSFMRTISKYRGTIKSATLLGNEYGYVRLFREIGNQEWRVEMHGSVQEY